MKIEMGKKYTSNGNPIRIICIDRPVEYPIIGMIEKTGSIYYFKENGEHVTFRNYNLVEVWEPKVGEWCLFWDYEKSKTIFVSCFVGVNEYGKFQCNSGITWNYCTKFTGELPEHLKDKK
jgi:hypothetical protein